jgi:multicomponent K+:H+ antiporter subunit C
MISYELLLASSIGVLVAAGIYLMLRARTFPVVMGLATLGYAVNLFLFGMGRVGIGKPPIIQDGVVEYVDPLPQALVLTAIVIGFGMTAFAITLAVKGFVIAGSDHMDGAEPEGKKAKKGKEGAR